MLSAHLPEPTCDIAAQIGALLDGAHPKDAVLLAPANTVPGDLPDFVSVVRRAGGTLLTTDARKATAFRKPDLSDDDMAAILGLPEPKSGIGNDLVGIVQALDANGAVITEAATSGKRLSDTVAALARHVPRDGSLVFVTIFDVIARRLAKHGVFHGVV